MHRKVAAAIVAALALALAGCGGSEKTTLDRAALVKRVEVACRDAQRAAEKAARAAGRSGNPFDGIRAGQKLLVERAEDLEASGSAKADYAAYKEGLKARLDAIEKVASADRADRQRVMRSVQREALAAGRRIELAARRLGIRNCS